MDPPPSWRGPRGQEPSFPRRSARPLQAACSGAALLGFALVVAGFGGWGPAASFPVAGASVASGAFVAAMGILGALRARGGRICAGCGGRPAVARGRMPLAQADELRTALDLVDGRRLDRILMLQDGQKPMSIELLHCPRCRDLGWLRAHAKVQGVPVRVGPTYVLLAPFLDDLLEELSQR